MGTPQEQDAVKLMRTALENPHGTSFERRQRLQKAWTFLRQSAAPTPASPQEGAHAYCELHDLFYNSNLHLDFLRKWLRMRTM